LCNYKVLLNQVKTYNNESLQSRLGLRGLDMLDDVLLCQAYSEFGKDLPLMMDGDFAFVLFDTQNNSYFCARDPLGIKAFYFTKINESYHFSSDIGDLLTLPSVTKKPNLRAMRTMIHNLRTVDYRETMYEGIYRLPPGHFMHIKDGQEQMERYWYPEKIEANYSISEEEAAKKLKALLSKAVDKRIDSLEETAFEVSGGLDSSSVVSLLAQSVSASAIDSYSMDFSYMKCDENEYIDALLKKYPLHHQKIVSGTLDYQEVYSFKHLYSMSPNWPITLTFAMLLPMLEQMKRDGKKVVISGQGGDHLFTGTPYVFYDLFRRFKFLTLYEELKGYKKPWSVFKVYVVRPLLGEKTTRLVKSLLGKKNAELPPKNVDEIIDLSQTVGIKDPVHKDALDMVTSAAHSTIMDGNIFHSAENTFGIEYRHPFFDKELVEFALSLPPEMKYKGGTIKWILRKAMDGILPDKIRDRTDKAEFSELLIQQIDAIDLNELLNAPYIVKLGVIEQSLIDKYRKEYEDKTGNITYLWIIINVEYWYRYNFEEAP